MIEPGTVRTGLLVFAALCATPVAFSQSETAPQPAAEDINQASLTRSSPDGRLSLTIRSDNGQPVYEVTRDGETVISPSKLGLRFASGLDLDRGFEVAGVTTAEADETWEQPWGEKRTIRDQHNEIAVTFRSLGDDGAQTFTVRGRIFDTGVAFRYEVPDTGERVLVDEITEFTVEPDAKSWWTPAGEFNRYEYIYKTTPVRDIYRVHTPYTLKYEGEDGPYLAIHEAALIDYAGMWLDQRRAGVLEADLAPRHDGSKVHIDGAFNTPWRVIQISDDAAGLINGSDIYLNLNEPNKLGDVSYFTPGKYVGIWWGMHINKYTWGSGPKHGATTENTKDYIDFAAKNGFSGVLVEGWNIGWDGDWFSNGDLFRFA